MDYLPNIYIGVYNVFSVSNISSYFREDRNLDLIMNYFQHKDAYISLSISGNQEYKWFIKEVDDLTGYILGKHLKYNQELSILN